MMCTESRSNGYSVTCEYHPIYIYNYNMVSKYVVTGVHERDYRKISSFPCFG